MGFGISCLIAGVLLFLTGINNIQSLLAIIPVSICMGALIIPIGVLGAYWRSYQTNWLWGGFLPTVRTWYGYAQPESEKPKKIDPTKVRVPRRVTISAAVVSMAVFLGMMLLLHKTGWNGPAWTGFLIMFIFSGLLSFSVYMTIVSSALSRRIQKLQNGEPIDD